MLLFAFSKMIRSNLKYSIIEGSFYALMFGLGENYISAMGVFLGYSALQISILNSFPQFIGAFAQLITNSLTKLFKSMKRFVVILSLLQAFLWIVLIYIINNTDSYLVILLWAVIYYTITSVMGPAWISWIGYLVPLKLRPNYHANRNKIINSMIFISIFFGGLILRFYKEDMILGFSIMFAIGAIGRIFSSYFLNKKNDAGKVEDGDNYRYKDILKNHAKLLFIAYNTSIHFSVMFLGPLFTIYILRTMNLSYLILTLCMVAWWLGNVFSSKYWGRLSKRKGNLYLLKMTTIIMCVLPVFWISVYYFDYEGRVIVSLLINLLAGFTFSGFGLSSFNILYEISGNQEVIKFSSLVNCLKGIAVFTGSIIAGSIVDSSYIINALLDYNFTSIQFSMVISIVLRCISYKVLTKLDLNNNPAIA